MPPISRAGVPHTEYNSPSALNRTSMASRVSQNVPFCDRKRPPNAPPRFPAFGLRRTRLKNQNTDYSFALQAFKSMRMRQYWAITFDEVSEYCGLQRNDHFYLSRNPRSRIRSRIVAKTWKIWKMRKSEVRMVGGFGSSSKHSQARCRGFESRHPL